MTVFPEWAVQEYSGLESRRKRWEAEGSKIQPSQGLVSGLKWPTLCQNKLPNQGQEVKKSATKSLKKSQRWAPWTEKSATNGQGKKATESITLPA